VQHESDHWEVAQDAVSEKNKEVESEEEAHKEKTGKDKVWTPEEVAKQREAAAAATDKAHKDLDRETEHGTLPRQRPQSDR
jgi:hypothetical protein